MAHEAPMLSALKGDRAQPPQHVENVLKSLPSFAIRDHQNMTSELIEVGGVGSRFPHVVHAIRQARLNTFEKIDQVDQKICKGKHVSSA